MRSSCLCFNFFDVSVLIEHIVGDCRRKSFCTGFLDFILRSFRKAPEHFLLFIFDLELYNTILELVVSVFLIVTCIYTAIFVQNRHSECIVSVLIRSIITLDLFFNDKTFERPVLDLHGIRVIVNIMVIIYLCHIIGQCDQIVEANFPVVLRCFQFLYMVNFVKIESIRISVESDLTVLIRYKSELLQAAAIVKVKVRILAEDLELYPLKFNARIVAINLDNLKTCLGAFTFRCRAVRLSIFDSLIFAIDADLVHDLLGAISSDTGIVGDGHFGRIGNNVCCYSRSAFSAAQTISDTLPGGFSHNTNRTILNTQVCAQHIRHGHIRSFIECRL